MMTACLQRRSDEPSVSSVVFVTMMFPAPSEAFAGVEIRALRSSGADVRVRALRGAHAMRDVLLDDWGLASLNVSHYGVASAMRGLVAMITRPARVLYISLWLWRHSWRSPGVMGKCAVLLPRMFDILQECEARPPTVLHLFWGHYPAVLAQLVRRYVPTIHISMALGAYDLVSKFGPSIAVANTADSLWTHAECNVHAIRELGIRNPRLQVLRRGVDFSQVPQELKNKRHGRVVTVARLESNKGVDDVLRAFSEACARSERRRLDLVVIGEGNDRRRLERLAVALGVEAVVHFKGAMRHSDVYEVLAKAEVLMLLSRNPSERLPNAVKEAIACRCICIVTSTPGIEELAAHPCNPLIVEQGDWKAAANLLVDTQERAQHYLDARDAGRAFIVRNFDASSLIKRRMHTWTTSANKATTA